MSKIVARGQYDERPVFPSDLDFSNDPGLTKQADAKDCDINSIFKRYEKTGQLPDMIVREPRYGDFSSVPSYQEAINIVRHAEEQFANLDVHLRNRFENDPVKFLEFCQDTKNLDEMEKLGLLSPDTVERRIKERETANAKANADAEAKNKSVRQALIDDVVKAIKGQ